MLGETEVLQEAGGKSYCGQLVGCRLGDLVSAPLCDS